MPVKRIIERPKDAVGVGYGGDFCNLVRADNFGLKPHVAMLRPLREQHVEPVTVVGQCDAADVMQTAGHVGDLFQFLIEPDRIPLQRRHIGVAIQRVKSARRVPCGPRCQFGPLDKNHVRPPQLGQVVEHRNAHNPATNHHHARLRFHRIPLNHPVGTKDVWFGAGGLSVHDTCCRLSGLRVNHPRTKTVPVQLFP